MDIGPTVRYPHNWMPHEFYLNRPFRREGQSGFHVLGDHLNSDGSVSNTVNYILVNHFYRKFGTNQTDAKEKACVAVLRLDSKVKNNAALKEIIIAHAFYDDPNYFLAEEVTNLFLSSHNNPEAYNEVKRLIPPRVATQV